MPQRYQSISLRNDTGTTSTSVRIKEIDHIRDSFCSDEESPILGLSKSVNRFQKLNRLGEGAYGIVYRAFDKDNEEIVALKRIRPIQENDGLPISSLREIKLLTRIKHENIVRVYEVVVGKGIDDIYMVMEYCEQDLAYLLDNVTTPFSKSEVKCLLLQLLRGLEYCHDHFIIHRDLKLSNLLLTSSGILKIADFGLARQMYHPLRPMTPRVVTLWYRAPELLFGEQSYTTAVDSWAVGCIFAELISRTPLLPGKNEQDQMEKIIRLLGTPHEGIWPGFSKLPLARSLLLPSQKYNNLKGLFPDCTKETLNLMNRFLTFDPNRRICIPDALQHEYFNEKPKAVDPSLMPTFPELRNIKKGSHHE